jgi:hypothetical protein
MSPRRCKSRSARAASPSLFGSWRPGPGARPPPPKTPPVVRPSGWPNGCSSPWSQPRNPWSEHKHHTQIWGQLSATEPTRAGIQGGRPRRGQPRPPRLGSATLPDQRPTRRTGPWRVPAGSRQPWCLASARGPTDTRNHRARWLHGAREPRPTVPPNPTGPTAPGPDPPCQVPEWSPLAPTPTPAIPFPSTPTPDQLRAARPGYTVINGTPSCGTRESRRPPVTSGHPRFRARAT